MLAFTFLLLLVPSILGGQITSWDIKYNLNNKGSQGTLYFYFKLSTPIAKDDYLRIVMPFPMSGITDVYWGVYAECDDTLVNQAAIMTASAISGDANAFFVSFYEDTEFTLPVGLVADTQYFLRFSGTPGSSSTTGVVGPVQVLTVSNNIGNWVTYDYNPVFGMIYLANDYTKLMTVTITIDIFQTTQNDVGAKYPVQFDIIPTVAIAGNARLDFIMTNPGFSISGCYSASSTLPSISAISAITYTQTNSYTIRMTIGQSLNAQRYRFFCNVTNPTTPGTGGLQVMSWYGNSDTIVESGIAATGLEAVSTVSTTLSWSEAYHKVTLGWGYEASNAASVNIFRLYKDASATEKWYQSVTTYFQPAQATSTIGIDFQVVVATIPDVGFTVLLNTINTNLPSYVAGTPITCTQSLGKLTCANVGSLTATQYWISFKFNIANTVAQSSVSNFATVTLQTSSGVTIIPTSATTLGVNQQSITNNPALFHSSGANGQIAYTTILPSTTTSYIHAGAPSILHFQFNYFTSNIITLNTATNNYGIEFYTSPNLPSSTSPTCSIATLTSGTDISITNCEVTSGTEFTVLRFRIANLMNTGAANTALWTATAKTGTISFNSVTFDSTKMSSLVNVDQYVYDFYARWVQGFTATTPSIVTRTGSLPFFFNSLVFYNTGLWYLNAAMTSFITGDTVTDVANDGAIFPTMIRIAGRLETAEQAQGTKLIVFFNDLTPIDLDNLCFGPTGTTCTYIDGGLSNTQTPNLVNYYGGRSIIIETDLTQSFNIYIPVATAATKKTIGLFVALASVIDATSTSLNIYRTTYSRAYGSQTYTKVNSGSTLTITAATGTTPRVDVAGLPPIASVANKNLINVGAGYAVTVSNVEPVSPGTAGLYGAAYGMCGNYDFRTAETFAFTRYPETTATAASLCVPVQYTPASGSTVYCQVCPVHGTPMTNGAAVPITQFTYPSNLGVDFGTLVYFSSLNSGNLQSVVYNQVAGALSQAQLTTQLLTPYPAIFMADSKNHFVNLNFTPAVPLPPNINVVITPAAPSTTLYFQPPIGTAGPPCLADTHTVSTCAISGSATSITVSFTSSTAWDVEEHQIGFYVDSTNPALASDTVVNFQVKITVQGLSTVVNHHSAPATPGTYTIAAVTAGLLSNFLTLSGFSYTFANKQARSKVQFTFNLPSDVAIVPLQVLRFNLGDLATANSGFAPICHILDTATNTPATAFLTCKTTNLRKLEISSKRAVAGTFTVVLPLMNVPSNKAPAGITGSLIAFDGSTIIKQSHPAQPLPLGATSTAALFSSVGLQVRRTYSDPGNVGNYTILIRPTRQAISLTTSLYIYFPSYFAPQLGYSNLYCEANSVRVSCYNTEDHLLVLTSFPTTVAVGNLLTVVLYGIIVPSAVSTQLESFFVALDNDTDVASVVEHGTYPDTLPNPTLPNAQLISAYSISSNIIRVNSSHTFTFPTDSVGVRAGSMMVFDFPDQIGGILQGGSAISVTLAAAGSTTGKKLTATSFGSRFKVNVTFDLTPYSYYTITFNSLQNVQFPACQYNRISMMIASSSEKAALYRTAPQGWNAKSVSYIQDPTLINLNWTTSTDDVISSLTLTTGVYSPLFKIIPDTTTKFQADFVVTSSNALFTTLSSPVNAYSGRLKATFRLAGTQSAYPNIYTVQFSKTESGSFNIYSELSAITVVMVSTPVVIPTYDIQMVIGGTSVPYYFNLEELDIIPQDSLVLTANIPTGSTLSIFGPQTLTFQPGSRVAGTFVFQLKDTTSLTDDITFYFTLAGTNAASYKLSNPNITVNVIANTTTPPVITSITFPANYHSNKQSMEVEADQPVTIYWHVAYTGSLVGQDCAEVKGSASDFTYNANDTVQAQYGAAYAYIPGTTYTSIISNLYSGTTYDIFGCAMNQLGYYSTPFTATFTTDSQGAGAYQANFEFSSGINKLQIKTLVCVLQSALQLPNNQ